MGFLRALLDFATPAELGRAGVLSMNHRNADLILPLNERRRYPRVDDKTRTKKICAERGIPTPEVFAVFERQGDLKGFPEVVVGRPDFVIKPAKGAGGRGILVVERHDGETFTRPDGEMLPLADVRYHMSTILSGLYSLGGRPDKVIIERRMICHPAFAEISYGGTPDIRVVLYRYEPALAMLRLPTRASRGRANLHQGAVGVGIDLGSGLTSGGVIGNETVSTHPDTGRSIEGFVIPGWTRIVGVARDLARSLELGYTGIDFVVDAARGPVVLEANARPGLAIQIANRRGLVDRLREMDGQESKA